MMEKVTGITLNTTFEPRYSRGPWDRAKYVHHNKVIFHILFCYWGEELAIIG